MALHKRANITSFDSRGRREFQALSENCQYCAVINAAWVPSRRAPDRLNTMRACLPLNKAASSRERFPRRAREPHRSVIAMSSAIPPRQKATAEVRAYPRHIRQGGGIIAICNMQFTRFPCNGKRGFIGQHCSGIGSSPALSAFFGWI